MVLLWMALRQEIENDFNEKRGRGDHRWRGRDRFGSSAISGGPCAAAGSDVSLAMIAIR